jgi:hypothetical protein
MCRSKVSPNKVQKKNKLNAVNEQTDNEDKYSSECMNFVENTTVAKVTVQAILVRLTMNGVSVNMELDSGSPATIMPKKQFDQLFKASKLSPPDIRLATYTGESLNVCGCETVVVNYETKSYDLKLSVVNGGNTALFPLPRGKRTLPLR